MFEVILRELQKKFGDKILLTPEDLVLITGISVGQQAKLRSEGRFPIPFEKLGGRIKINIFHLAEYLASKANNYAKSKMKEDKKESGNLVNNRLVARKDNKKKNEKGRLKDNWFREFLAMFCSHFEKMELNNISKSRIGKNFIKL
ncbi:hypothetical protein PQU95_02575 [Vogesella sp. DC21W]|uniref:DNA-binding protein n=1 Tax=Vogesella aquatica TaxID=2984206 RepID=A0ABT5IU60_9NEIS|nr:hypothetical protein [Vogesella aquatica]MDC7716108.1 hypothetical protein [Vogesella aquatica]